MNGWNGKGNDEKRERTAESHAWKTTLNERLRNQHDVKVLRQHRL